MGLPRVERGVAELLERGDGPSAVLLNGVWEAAARRSLRRPLPTCRALIVSVMGATLGGSWKTPVALAVAITLRERGAVVGFVSHAFGATDRSTRVVSQSALAGDVGDEGFMSARALSSVGIPVVTGGALAARLDALRDADIIVIDGCARASTRRGHVTILALDAARPWGSGASPPTGDLKARPHDLLGAADVVIAVHDAKARPPALAPELAGALRASFDMGGIDAVAGLRMALVTALARPDRVARALARRGVNVVHHVALADHGGPWVEGAALRELAKAPTFDAVVTTEKCAAWLPDRLLGRSVHPLPLVLTLPDSLDLGL